MIVLFVLGLVITYFGFKGILSTDGIIGAVMSIPFFFAGVFMTIAAVV